MWVCVRSYKRSWVCGFMYGTGLRGWLRAELCVRAAEHAASCASCACPRAYPAACLAARACPRADPAAYLAACAASCACLRAYPAVCLAACAASRIVTISRYGFSKSATIISTRAVAHPTFSEVSRPRFGYLIQFLYRQLHFVFALFKAQSPNRLRRVVELSVVHKLQVSSF